MFCFTVTGIKLNRFSYRLSGSNFCVRKLCVKSIVFWDVVPCGLVDVYRRFGGMFLHFHIPHPIHNYPLGSRKSHKVSLTRLENVYSVKVAQDRV